MSLAERTARYVPKIAAIANIAGGVGGFLGWMLQITLLMSVFNGLPVMKPNTAVCLILLGIALLIPPQSTGTQARFGRVCAGLAGIIGLMTLVEYVVGIDLHIDQLFSATIPTGVNSPRTSPFIAATILLFSAGLLSMDLKWLPSRACQALLVLACLGPLAVVTGYLYSITQLGPFVSYTLMAFHSALLLLMLGVGMLFRYPDVGMASIFLDETAGGSLARRVLPAVLAVPLFIAALIVQLEGIGWIDARHGHSLNAFANVVVLGALTTWVTWLLRQVERTRRAAEENALQERQSLKVTLASIGDGVIATDNHMQVTFLNPVAENLTGWKLSEAAGHKVDEIFRLINEKTRLPVPSPVQTALGSGGIARVEQPTLLISRNGTERPIDNSAAPIRSLLGEIAGAVLIFNDVTERRRQEAELQHSERRFRATFEQAAVGCGLAAPSGRFLRVNQRLCDMTGYSREELESMSYRQITHPDDIAADDEQTTQLLSGEVEKFALEKRYIRKDGSDFWINLTVSLSRTQDGKPDFFIGVIEDITRRKSAEEALVWAHAETEQRVRDRTAELATASEALRISGERTRLILDSAYEAFIAMDSRGVVADCNLQTEAVFGFTRDEMMGQLLDEKIIPPGVREAHTRGLKRFLETGASELINRPTEFMALHKDGHTFPVELTITAVRTSDGWLFAAFVRDISKRKEMQDALLREREFLNAVLDQVEAGIITSDAEGNLLTVNRMMREIHGEPGGETAPVQWSPYFDVYHADATTLVNPAETPLFRALRGETVRNVELVARPKNRPPRHMVVNARAISGADGARLGAVLAAHDITEQKIAEKMLRDSLQEKVVLLKEIHHRVKNNLQIVSSLLSLQASVLHDEHLSKLFLESQNRLRSMALIHEMLYQSPDLAHLDFAAYVQSLVNYLFQSYDATARHVASAISIPDARMDIDTAVPCGLIITELVSNCLKYAFPDNRGGTVKIELTRNGDGGTLRVADNGIGLPATFELKAARSLGLQLVQRLARQMGGKVEQEQFGTGTSFRVNF